MGRASNRKWAARQAAYRTARKVSDRLRLVALFGRRARFWRKAS